MIKNGKPFRAPAGEKMAMRKIIQNAGNGEKKKRKASYKVLNFFWNAGSSSPKHLPLESSILHKNTCFSMLCMLPTLIGFGMLGHRA